jgi:hypothetical protein
MPLPNIDKGRRQDKARHQPFRKKRAFMETLSGHGLISYDKRIVALTGF